MRKIIFENNKYYHIFNRGVEKRDIFLDSKDFARFITSIREFNVVGSIGSLKEELGRKIRTLSVCGRHSASESKPRLIDIICYCLNKNHFHFILKQQQEFGISQFMLKLTMGYAKYFNIKYSRSGSLFQGPFQAKYIDTAKYLVWCSAYVNSNVEIHKLAKAKNYQWSSYKDYLNLRNGTICDKITVMDEFNNNTREYEEFVEAVIKDCQTRKEAVKKYLNDLK
jgi:REP element-mobilizing transposase RayT